MSNFLRLLRKSHKNPLISTLRHTTLQPGSRAFTGRTEEQPIPKHVYQYMYVFEYYPEALGAFNVYSVKRDQFVLEHFFMLENFDYEYEGQQWHIGSYGMHLLMVFLPFYFYLSLISEDVSHERTKSTKNRNYCQTGGFMPFELVRLDYDAVVE